MIHRQENNTSIESKMMKGRTEKKGATEGVNPKEFRAAETGSRQFAKLHILAVRVHVEG